MACATVCFFSPDESLGGYTLCVAGHQRWRAISCVTSSRHRRVLDVSGKALIDNLNSPAGAHPSGVIGQDPLAQTRESFTPAHPHGHIGHVKDSILKVFGNDYPTP